MFALKESSGVHFVTPNILHVARQYGGGNEWLSLHLISLC